MPRVLIVDDLEENLYFLETLLKGNGFDVCSAHNGAEALASARNNPPDLIVSDILMPVMDGYALCREWRADAALRQIPFIFYTATFTEKNDEKLALSLGADRFVIKPQEPAPLMAIISEVLDKARDGGASSSTKSACDDNQDLKEYSESLFRKLEKKMADLERVNRELQEDIIERQRADEKYRELYSQLMHQDKLATIGQLAAGVAHEINNPIGFIGSNMVTLEKYIVKYNSYIERLEKEMCAATASGTLPEAIRELRCSLKLDLMMHDIDELVNENNEGLERVRRIVHDLSTFSRSDVSVNGLTDLNSCLECTINIVMNEIKFAADLKLEYGELPLVPCNAQQISQIFLNLLINATHAIRERGEVIGKIVVRTWCDSDNAFVSVSDNGCGIPPENMGKVFDAFFTTKDMEKGTGLGLSISYGIAHNHGGDITVHSKVGVGSTFTVRLPVDGAAAPAV